MSPVKSADFPLVTLDGHCVAPVSFRVPQVNLSLTAAASEVARVGRDGTSHVERGSGKASLGGCEGAEGRRVC